MSIPPPTRVEINELAERLGLHFESAELDSYHGLVSGIVGAFAVLDAAPDDLPEPRYPRSPGSRPPDDENPLGAWAVKSRIQGARSGPLAGRSVVLKDNVMLAGVPLANGISILDGYVPPMDATIVTRILDAGGTILGKAVCEAHCFSAGSHTSASGPVRNPHRPTHSTGGSSSGCAALVANGEAEMAIGGDQGGSIRVPASFCGIVGMKPTWSLVPYTGILGIEPTVDHTGPMTANVADNALLLQVIAGPDGLDSRQSPRPTENYNDALSSGIEGLRIGVMSEGFARPDSQPEVDAMVRSAAQRFEKLGAQVSPISVPEHLSGGLQGFGAVQSFVHTMLMTDGFATGREDLFPTSYMDAHRRWRERASELSAPMKTLLLLSEYLRERSGYRLVARSMNSMRGLRAAYDAALADCDALLMPTVPTVAPPLPEPDAPPEVQVAHAFASAGNTMPFDHTHHPALSFPCGTHDGLPVGAMLVGRHFEECTLYRLAYAFEQHAEWRSLH